MAQVDDSRKKKEEISEIWDEVDQNFLLRDYKDSSLRSNTRAPLAGNELFGRQRQGSVSVRLKDPETHQECLTIASKITLALFPATEAFVAAHHVGFEDIPRQLVVQKLIEYISRKPSTYRAWVEDMLQTTVRGTSILQSEWRYREEPRVFRELGRNEFGEQTSRLQTLIVPVENDVCHSVVDVRDFFPDAGCTSLEDASGASVRIRLSGQELKRRAEAGLYNKAAVKKILDAQVSADALDQQDHPEDDETALSHRRESSPANGKYIGYEYIGNVPFRTSDGVSRRVITVIQGEVVRSDPWPRGLPWFDGRITPRLGSFWGIGTGEIARQDQEFADVLKRQLAMAVTRMTNPGHIVRRGAGVNLAQLRAFRPRVPIVADDVDAIRQIDYRPPVEAAFNMHAGIKQQMREASGALGAIQGLGLGTKRFSASEAVGSLQHALDRPELFGQVIERDKLPRVAQYDLALCREFIETDEDLADRVGESNMVAGLADIMDPFDIRFTGSRVENSSQEKSAAYQEIFALGANPVAAQIIPWIPVLKGYLEDRGMSQIAAMVGNPDYVALHLLLQQITTQGAGNGAVDPATGNGANLPGEGDPNLLPAQALGRVGVA